MIDDSEKRNRHLAFELQNSHVCEKRSKASSGKKQQQQQNNKDENEQVSETIEVKS